MLVSPSPFVPPAPVPRNTPPSRLEIIRTVMRNPLELWGEPSFRLKWIKTRFFNERTLIANHPGLVRHGERQTADGHGGVGAGRDRAFGFDLVVTVPDFADVDLPRVVVRVDPAPVSEAHPPRATCGCGNRHAKETP